MLLKEETRGLLYKKKSVIPGVKSLSFIKILFLSLLVAAAFFIALYYASPLKDYLYIMDSPAVKFKFLFGLGVELFILVQSIVIVLMIFSTSFSIESRYLKSLPINRHFFNIPRLMIYMMEGVFYFILIFMPANVLMLYLMDVGAGRMLLLCLLLLVLYLVYTMSVLFIFNFLATIFSFLKSQRGLMAMMLVFGGSVLLAGTYMISLKEGPGWKSYFQWNELLREKLGGGFYMGTADSASTGGLILLILLLAFLFIGLTILTSICIGEHEEKPLISSAPVFGRSVIFKKSLSSRPYSAYFARDLLLLMRDPLKLFTQVIVYTVITILFYNIFKDNFHKIALYLIYSFPAMLTNTLFLHSIGREGSQISLLNLVTGARRMLRIRIIVGIVFSVPFTIALYFLFYFVLQLPFDSYRLWMRLLILVLITPISVILTLGCGAYFADFNPKRLFPDRGISIGGEMLYWLINGIFPLIVYMIDSILLMGNDSKIVKILAITFGAATLFLAFWLFKKGGGKITQFD